MRKEFELWKFIAEKLKRDETAMLLIVAESAGSSPGRQGFKMAVAADGELCGSVGGGVMEVNLVEDARTLISNAETPKRRDGKESEKKRRDSANRKPQTAIIEQIHRKNSPHASGMICSGKQKIIFYRLDFGDLPIVRRILCAFEKHQPEILRISNLKFEISENRSVDFDFRFSQQNEKEFFYEEKLGYKNRLFIVGGGHCALSLSELMSKMDFYVTLFDDRKDLNTLEKNRFANEKKIIESYENIGDYIESGKNVYVVVMTLGYKFDELVVRKLFDKNFKYFGVLGSRAKMAALLKNLREAGFDAEKLNRIRTPAGVEINSRTPEEIAVSIAAEIIAVKNASG